MLSEADTVKLIFGLKIQQLRKERSMSYQQLSDSTGLAISYLHNIEKGKKYPKADKIFALAKALESDYNYLVSLEAGKKLQPIIDLLQSDFLKVFPLDLFGINPAKMIELLSQSPDRVNAFIHTILKITRNFHLQGEDFHKAALRSYQDMHDNYFENLEAAVQQFKVENKLKEHKTFSNKDLSRFLSELYSVQVDREELSHRKDLKQVRSYYVPRNKTLYINKHLNAPQINFLLAKELAFQYLQPSDRPYETRMLSSESFDKLLNNFRASYFAVALLMDEEEMIKDIRYLASQSIWKPELLLNLLEKYQVTSEMLIQRLANILPEHFSINDLFFLRFNAYPSLKKFIMTKEMHLSQLHSPHAIQLDETYCRRWISISLIRRLKAQQGINEVEGPIADAQLSRYYKTSNTYLCITLAKPDWDNAEFSTSVTIGLLLNDQLKDLFKFLDDPQLKTKDVNNSCQRCAITDCGSRAAPPTLLQQEKELENIKKGLSTLNP